MKTKKYVRLVRKDRDRIELWLEAGIDGSQIAGRLRFHPSTICREIARGRDSLGNYRANYAQKKSRKRASSRGLGKRKILKYGMLKQYVEAKLKIAWSPYQIAKKLKETYTEPYMHISPEAIYQYIYILPRGTLKKTLTEGLRQNRKYRRTHRQERQDEEMRGKIRDMLSIHERPAEVADRTIPGHWEGDLIIGKYKRTAIATLVE